MIAIKILSGTIAIRFFFFNQTHVENNLGNAYDILQQKTGLDAKKTVR